MRGLLGSLAGLEDLGPEALEVAYDLDPVVRANFVVALDGSVELGGVSGRLGGPADRDLFGALRSLADVILVGAGTIRAEGYGPAWLDSESRARRRLRGQSDLPSVAVVTNRAQVDPGSRLFHERREDQPVPPTPVVICGSSAPPERLAALQGGARILPCGSEGVDLEAAVSWLRAQGWTRILCEGGPSLFTAMAAAGLLDEVCLTHAPLLAGPGRVTLCRAGEGAAGGFPVRGRLTDLLEGDGLLMARYRVERSSDG